jgi:alkylation response protein AidB-like acyl-CoA dehydrogenase
MDGQVVANIRFRDVAVRAEDILGSPGQGYADLEDTIAEATLAVSAEAVGILEVLNEITLDYVKTRKQFGVAIGSFQALQHRLVDMFAASEQTRSLLYRAICSVGETGFAGNSDIVALKAMVGKAGRLIGGEAIQMHGGMGITDELDVGRYVKRLMTIDASFGDADFQRRRFADLTLGRAVADDLVASA